MGYINKRCKTNMDNNWFIKKHDSYSIIILAILIGICGSIYFMEFLNSYVLFQSIFIGTYFIYIVLNNRSINIEKNKGLLLLMLFSMYLIFNILIDGSISFVFVFCLNILLLICLSLKPNVNNLLAKIMAIYAGVHLFFTGIVSLLPVNITNVIFQFILGEKYLSNWDWRVQQNSNVGITNQPGNNAMYLTTLLAFCVAHIIVEHKDRKITYWILTILSFIGVVVTNKRAPIILNLVVICLIYFIHNKRKISVNKIIKMILGSISFLILYFILYQKTDIFSGIISKNSLLTSTNDITNGRIELWRYGIEQFKKNPILGVGIKRIYEIRGLDLHNIYIQILAETGIIGFLMFLTSIITILINSFKAIKDLKYYNDTCTKRTTIMGVYLSIYLILYGVISNPFIDYIPLAIFMCSIFMANSYKLRGER